MVRDEPEPGRPLTRLDEYEVLHALGRGGMGTVYLAHDTVLDRPVAIKIGHGAAVRVEERVLVEARAAARIHHPNVATVFRVGRTGDGRAFIVSELVRGTSLDRIARPLPWPQVRTLGIELASGLAAAHRQGVLHRDLKPANAILGDDGHVKLVDFGLAKLAVGGRAGSAPPLATGDDTGSDPTLTSEGPDGSYHTMSLPLADTAAAEAVYESRPLLRSTGRAKTPAQSPPEEIGSADGASAVRIPDDLTRAGVVVGTPSYLAPERWRGEPATVASDLYALGALLYELLASAPPFRAETRAELGERIQSAALPPLAERGVPPAVAAVVERCLARDPAQRFASAEDLRDALEQLRGDDAAVEAPAGNPYRGLLPFDAPHRALFFGRDREIRGVIDRLRAAPLIVVTGESGIGKSSLVRAGVLPRIVDGALDDGRRWRAVALEPGRRPLHALAAAVAATAGADGDLAARLAEDPGAAARDVAAAVARDGAGLVVFVDQLEELVTTADPVDAAAAARALALLAGAGAGVRVIGSVRADYLARVGALDELGEAASRAIVLVRPLTADGVRETITGPARAAGVTFASDAMVDELVAAAVAAPAGLPLLQFVLAELWEARDPATGVIADDALVRLGGVGGAVARHADAVLDAMTAGQRRAARGVLLRLVTRHRTRARLDAAELADDGAARDAVEALVRGRLVVARDSDDGPGYQLAHDVLIDTWERLRSWLDDEAGARADRERLALAAADWDRLGRRVDDLWRGRALAAAAAIPMAGIGPRERAFVAASKRARLRRRAVVAGLGVALAAAVGAGWSASRAQVRVERDREVARRVADADGGLAGARAAAAALEPLRAEAFAAFDQPARPLGEERWQALRGRAADVERQYARAGLGLEAALRLDPSRADIRARHADLLLERALLAETRHDGDAVAELVERLGLHDDDGRRLRAWRAPATLTATVAPAGAALSIARIDDAGGGRLREGAAAAWDGAPRSLAPGSYVVRAAHPGRAPVAAPVRLTRGEHHALSLALPPAAAVPPGFVFVPAGRFLFGSGDDEPMRQWYDTAPLHPRTTPAYLIARTETTFADWIAFLDAQPAGAAERLRPQVAGSHYGTMSLDRDASGRWTLTLQPTTHAYRVAWGEPLVYLERDRRTRQDWGRLPVVGISSTQARAYVDWLRATGRVGGARLCREDEWERAARGADDRRFAHGDRLDPDDANFDETYGRKGPAFGPDEIGSHPASRSPFGLDDATGNVLELTTSVLADDEIVVRGGSFFVAARSNATVNRWRIEADQALPMVGLRVCADAPQPR